MASSRSSPHSECPIGLFEGHETQIERLAAAVNRASAPEENGRLARELLENLSALLDCNAYDQNDSYCRLCRDVSMSRRKTATVIDCATALGRQPSRGAEE